MNPSPCAFLRPLAPWVAAFATALPASAPALTIRVHPDSVGVADHVATVLEANAMVAFGDSIEVSAAGSPYVLTDTMALVDGVVYRGGFGPDFEGPDAATYETVIELQPAPGEFPSVLDAFATGSTTVFAGFTVTGGNASFSAGGITCGDLLLRDCRFTGNFAAVVGGGIMVPAGSAPYVYNCDVDTCSAGQRGGGIAVAAGADGTRIESCRITACSSSASGISTGGGGGVFVASAIEFVRNTVQACSTGTHGGAILVRNASGPDFLTNFLFDNVAALDGGGIYQDGGNATYQGLQIERCAAGRDGGAAFFRTSTTTVSGSFIRSCTAIARGGGFCVEGNVGSLLTTTEFVGNQAATGGGMEISGLPFRASESVEIRNNTFALNGATTADAGGGLHFAGPGFLDVVANNILAFQTDGAGVGIVGIANSPTLLNNCVYNDDAANLDAEYGGIPDRTGANGNIRQLPRFCNLMADPAQLGLNINSPCLGAGYGGVDIGAHQGSDCSVLISVEPTTWSRIKSYYR